MKIKDGLANDPESMVPTSDSAQLRKRADGFKNQITLDRLCIIILRSCIALSFRNKKWQSDISNMPDLFCWGTCQQIIESEYHRFTTTTNICLRGSQEHDSKCDQI